MKTVLIIEDNETNLYLARFILEKNGCKVLEEREGLPGVDTALRERPDLVIMDIQLPDITGLEATR
ncbi:MAG: response regulator, partial [Peptococcaceae bacterium]